MNSPLADKRVLIWDKGLFVHLAEKLAPHAAKVMYHQPWDGAFPHPSDVAVGMGIPGVERVNDFFDAIDHADLVIFPDVGNGDLQEWLRERGYRVWGSGGGQWLELDRVQSREHFAAAGVAVPPTERVLGLTALRKLLDKTEDRWVKISLFRGAFETFHHVKPFMTRQWLKTIDRELGPMADHLEFQVEEVVEGIEVGWDCHTVDGAYPDLGYCGVEVKDKAIIGRLVEFAALPESMRAAYAAAAPALAAGKYRNYFSIEARVAERGGPAVVIDPCCRFGSPCTEAWVELVANLPEVLWAGAGGEMAQVVPAARYAALAVMNCEPATANWTPIDVPKDVRPWVKMKCLTVVGGKYYYVPGDLKMSEVGVVVGVGDSVDAAVGLVEDRAARISGYKLDIQVAALREGSDALDAAESVGLPVK